MSALLRVLTLLALVLMPFAMTAAPAAAHAMPAMADGHCDDQHPPDGPQRSDMAQCMLMCAALPAAEVPALSSPTVPKAPPRVALADPIHGIILEIATPPPRDA